MDEQEPDILVVVDEAVDAFYWQLFNKRVGAKFHSFIEWCGVMSEYVKMVKQTGVDPFLLNTHSNTAQPIHAFQLYYMAEKLNCILAPFLRSATDEEKKEFVRVLLEGD